MCCTVNNGRRLILTGYASRQRSLRTPRTHLSPLLMTATTWPPYTEIPDVESSLVAGSAQVSKIRHHALLMLSFRGDKTKAIVLCATTTIIMILLLLCAACSTSFVFLGQADNGRSSMNNNLIPMEKIIVIQAEKEPNTTSKSLDCTSPFAAGRDERNRLIQCGYGDIVLAAYDADRHFAEQVLSLLRSHEDNDNDNENTHYQTTLEQNFAFYLHSAKRTAGDCRRGSKSDSTLDILCHLLERNVVHAVASAGNIAARIMFDDDEDDPDTDDDDDDSRLSLDFLQMFCSMCNDNSEEYQTPPDDDSSFTTTAEGGASGGSGFTIYCTEMSGKNNNNNMSTTTSSSNEILRVSGGGGAGASGLGMQWSGGGGGGGGGGFQITLSERNATTTTVHCGGGYGGRVVKDETNEGSTDAACQTTAFVKAIESARKAISACQKDPNSKLSLSSGGGSGGGVSDDEIGFRFSSGFRFNVGPTPITGTDRKTSRQPQAQLKKKGKQHHKSGSRSSFSSSSNSSASSAIIISCSYAYANALCAKVGYGPKDIYSQCLCPVQQLYSPPAYPYKCNYNNTTNRTTTTVNASLIEANCNVWCPQNNNVTYSGAVCPALSACSCKM